MWIINKQITVQSIVVSGATFTCSVLLLLYDMQLKEFASICELHVHVHVMYLLPS